MAFNHGLTTRQVDTTVSTPVAANSGIAFFVGTAPIHVVDGKVNEPVLCQSYSEAVSALGYSDDWDKYTLCEGIYSQFKLYNVAPVVFVNVLDPQKHKTAVDEEAYTVVDKKVLLPLETIKSSVNVTTYNAGTDYELFYSGNNLVLEIIDGGGIAEGTNQLSISFDKVDPSKVTEDDIIGGFDTTTKKTSGFELVDSVFPRFGIVVDLLLAPAWSHKPTVAAIMGAKASKINGLFDAKALIDVDAATVNHYADVPAWKKKNNINSKTQLLCYPMSGLGDMSFHLSTHAAGLMATVDTNNGGCPCESPSNKSLKIDKTILADKTEVLLDVKQANHLNSNGVITALNFIGGYKLWGNETACYPADRDIKNYFICVSRMFNWVANSIVLTYWSKIDKKMTDRYVDSIVDSINIWLNGLTAEGKLLGGRVEFKDEENSLVSLMDGRAVFHVYLTPPSPAKELEFVLEYDVNYLSSALA